jgi:hypothetical protein
MGWVRLVLAVVAGSTLACSAGAQVTPSQNVVSTPPVSIEPISKAPASTAPPSPELTPSGKPIPPSNENTPDITIDPASLLPDLPPLPPEKASLIGGTIGKLDRVRDQIMVQVFGGGKIKIAFDTRTHIYHDGVEASTSDLKPGDRVYVDTILDGSTVFARSIRLRGANTVAGESQGIITNYRADKGELQLRDALSPHTINIRVTPQTKIIHGDRVSSSSELSSGTLVAVKFGPRQDGGEVAREVSVLAVPGASFTFGGIVTAVDLRLGLIVLTSSSDHKSYEIYLDPSVTIADDVRPSADITVLTRFQDNKYVARSVTVNFPAK